MQLHISARPTILALLVAPLALAPLALGLSAPARAAMAPQQAQVALGNLPLRAMWALESNDVGTLAILAHSKGVRFTPYLFAYESDLKFSPRQIRAFKNSKRKYLWGGYDGTGDPIRLTWAQYRKDFVWPRDFSTGTIRYNLDRYDKIGNKVNNLREFYPNSIVVQSFKPGTNPKFGGADWRELWLVFQKDPRDKGKWKLAGISSNQWTT